MKLAASVPQTSLPVDPGLWRRILGIATNHPSCALWSAHALAECADCAPLVIDSVVYAEVELGLPPRSTWFHSKREGLIQNPRKRFATAPEQAGIQGVAWRTLRRLR